MSQNQLMDVYEYFNANPLSDQKKSKNVYLSIIF